jgi:hypothetical protein
MPVPAVSMLDATISRYAWSASNAGTHGIRRLNCGAPRNSTTTLIAVFLDTSLQPGYIFASSPSKTAPRLNRVPGSLQRLTRQKI